MKKILLAGSAMIAAVTIASAAQAADVAVVAPGYDWTGFYLGANAGVAWNNSSVDNDSNFDGERLDNLENKINGDQAAFTAGGLIGYNYQIDQIVLGVEADINYLGFSDSNSRSFSFDHPTQDDPIPMTLTGKSSMEVDWFGTIRGRLGYAIDNVLLYGTGGAAYGHVSADGKLDLDVDGQHFDEWKASNDATNWGWTLGAGMEYGIDNWSLGVEYLYVDLGDGNWKDNHQNEDLGPHGDVSVNGSADFAFSVVRATAKVRF